jgi:hypothetical protein
VAARDERVSPRAERPLSLVLAVAAVSAEALALLGLGSWLGYSSAVSTPDNAAVAQGTTAYFLVLGAGVAFLAASLWRGRGWSAGPATFLQLLALPMAWYMAREGLLVGAAPLAGVALTGLGGLLAPATRQALGR